MGRGRGDRVGLDEDVERFGLDTAETREEARNRIAVKLRRFYEDDGEDEPLLKAFLDLLATERDEILTDCDDLLSKERDEIFDDLIFNLEHLAPRINQIVWAACTPDESALIVRDDEDTFHLRAAIDSPNTLCGFNINPKSWQTSSRENLWPDERQRCPICAEKARDEQTPTEVRMAAREDSLGTSYLSGEEEQAILNYERELLFGRLKEWEPEWIRGAALDELLDPGCEAIAEWAAKAVSRRLGAMNDEDQLYWLTTADNDSFPLLKQQVEQIYSQDGKVTLPSADELESVYKATILECERNYRDLELRIALPVFVIAHLWPKALTLYQSGLSAIELAQLTIAAMRG